MKSNRTGTTLEVSLEGAIGESTPLFSLPLEKATEVILDLGKVTYINSIGVKHWILWAGKLPRDCKVKMVNCPFVFASQASAVVGFTPPGVTIESLRLPYACENCGFEETYLAERGRDFEYAGGGQPGRVSAPEHRACPKCKTERLEPDFVYQKTFKFLD